MKNRHALYFLIRFSLAILVAIAILVSVGIIAYKSLDTLVSTIAEEAKPNNTVTVLKELQYDLADADLNARSYSLTGETSNIQAFYKKMEDSRNKLRKLRALSTNKLQNDRIDNIQELITEKAEIMQGLITLKADSSTAAQQLEEFRKGLRQLKANENKAAEQKEILKPQRQNIFKRLFGKKEKESVKKVDTIPQPTVHLSSSHIIAQLLRQIDSITRTQGSTAERKKQAEMTIIEKDKKVTANIRQIIERFNRDELNYSMIVARKARETAAYTTNIIFGLSLLTVIVLVTSGSIVFAYIRANLRYRKVLSESKNRAEHLAKLRLEFLSSMSHEIRTPLNAIVGFSEQLGKKRLLPDQEQAVRIIKESSEHLSGLISDILDHAKMESGKFNFEHIAFKPMDVFQQVFDFYSYEAHKKGLILSLFYINNIPEYIVGDPLRLKQILLNLVSNAMKFTSKGFIKMEVKSLEHTENEIILNIKITDSGIGIAPEKQKFIFDEYTQAESNTTRKYGGTGLGLSITKKLIEAQGGSIDLISEINNGTTFEITLPFDINMQSVPKVNTDLKFKDLEAVKNLRILAADDENYNRLLLVHIFNKWGVKLDLAVDGIEVIDKVSVEDYDLILMDVKMPYLDGIQATIKIRESFGQGKKSVPIIGVTAGTLTVNKQKCLDAGMDNFITKPFKEAELIRVIADTLKLETMEVDSYENSEPDTNATDFDFKELKEIIGNDTELLDKMIETFINSSGKTMEEIEDAVQRNDFREVTLLAHRLAAPARHMGFRLIVTKLRSIEHFEDEKMSKPKLLQLIDEVKKDIANVNEKLKNRMNLRT